MKKASVIGAGAWGTALGTVLSDNGYRVVFWDRKVPVVREINEKRRSMRLHGKALPDTVSATSDGREAVAGAEMVVSAVPSAAVSEIAGAFAPLLPSDCLLVSATKGLDPKTLRRPVQVWCQAESSLAHRVTAISGPNFAVEIADKLPAATVVAGESRHARMQAQSAFVTPYLRVYTHWDITGVELGGALKNIIAIATGMVEGMEAGYNAQAALISRGIAEITRLGVVLGANPLTFAGLSGIGDLVLTATGHLSRNRQAGIAVGRGESIRSFIDRTGYTVEGLDTVRSAVKLADEYEVSMPITQVVHRILYENLPVRTGLREVMDRARRPEHEPYFSGGEQGAL